MQNVLDNMLNEYEGPTIISYSEAELADAVGVFGDISNIIR